METASLTLFIHTSWWINLAAAQRDGMVGSKFERLSKGLYGLAVL